MPPHGDDPLAPGRPEASAEPTSHRYWWEPGEIERYLAWAGDDPERMAQVRALFRSMLETMQEMGIPTKAEWWALTKPPAGLH